MVHVCDHKCIKHLIQEEKARDRFSYEGSATLSVKREIFWIGVTQNCMPMNNNNLTTC